MDPDQYNYIYNWTIDELKQYLRDRNINFSNATKTVLQDRVIQAVKCQITGQSGDTSVQDTINSKLVLENGLIRLPHPETIQNWEVHSASTPLLTSGQVQCYFKRVHENLGVTPKEYKALALGKGLSESGHVDNIFYSEISPSINYCFVKTCVMRQTNVRETHMLFGPFSTFCMCIYIFTCKCMHMGV